jgi:hypothetical protein
VPVDTLKPVLNTIKTPILNCYLGMHVRELRLQMRQSHLDARHPNLHVANVLANLILSALKRLYSTPKDLELLHDEIGRFVGHMLNLTPFGLQIHR